MNVNKQQIINGFVKYMNEEVIEKITDKPLKIAIATGVAMLQANPNLANKILDDDMVSMVLNKKVDGTSETYEIDAILRTLKTSIDRYGDFPVKIPAIKFISPTEKELQFSGRDIERLKECIIGSNAGNNINNNVGGNN